MTIPASDIVSVIPGVISAGGSPLSLNTVVLTENTAVPVGTVSSFSTTQAVGEFFGFSSDEYTFAGLYFNGFDNSNIKPGTIYFSQFASADVAGYLRGGSLSDMTLTQLQALSGTLTVSVDGTPVTSSSINLSSATSFSNAATIIAAGFTGLGATVSYDSQRAAFKFTSDTTGAASSLSYATGTLSAGIKLTAATGAVLSPGSDAMVEAEAMTAITTVTQNWACFASIFEPDLTSKLAFAAWVNGTNDRYAYVCWDTDVTPTQSDSATGSFGYLVAQNEYNGVYPVWNTMALAAFACGTAASIDFNQTNGRITFAFKSQSGFTATVTDVTTAGHLEANGYNFYGKYATANDQFNFMYPGSMPGDWKWMDAYVNQIYLNSQFQLALMELLVNVKSIPYNQTGYTLIRQAAQDPINQFLNFGGIQPNVPLSAQQAAIVNQQAGVQISGTLSTRGWYFQVLPASAQVRGNRASPPCTFFYTDGGSVQRLNLASIDVM